MTYQVGKIDAASDQLDWSIKLFLDHKAYVPAITLAGAAEEIIGQTLGSEAAFNLLKDLLSIKTGLPPKDVSQMYLNRAKNWLKHWRDMKDEESIEIDLETEAIQYIFRAATNLAAHDKSCTSETPRFIKWIEINRNDLLGE